MKVLIVDDEPKARRILKSYIEEYSPAFKVIESVDSVAEAVKAIKKHQPEIVLLDIDMPGEDGFALFNYFDSIDFHVIFVTASREHAIEAFKVSALDYILKPIDISQLIKALEKARHYRQPMLREQISMLNRNLRSTNNKNTSDNGDSGINRIAISLMESIEFIKLEDIIFLKADGSYTEFYLEGDRKLLSSKPIGDYDIIEKQPGFMKTHRSFLINLPKVQSYQKESGGYIVMKNNHSVNLSRYKKEEFLNAMGKV